MLKLTALLTCAAIACSGNNTCVIPETPVCTAPSAGIQTQQPLPEAAPVSAYVQEVVRLVNIERANAGLAPLVLDTQLCEAAAIRAQEIDIDFSHSRPDGSSGFSVLKELGISYRAVGENIAKGSPTPERVVQDWMHSAGHRANILHKNFTTIGVGVHEDNAGVLHWVQLFTA